MAHSWNQDCPKTFCESMESKSTQVIGMYNIHQLYISYIQCKLQGIICKDGHLLSPQRKMANSKSFWSKYLKCQQLDYETRRVYGSLEKPQQFTGWYWILHGDIIETSASSMT